MAVLKIIFCYDFGAALSLSDKNAPVPLIRIFPGVIHNEIVFTVSTVWDRSFFLLENFFSGIFYADTRNRKYSGISIVSNSGIKVGLSPLKKIR